MARYWNEATSFGETEGCPSLGEDLFQALPKLQHYTRCLTGSSEMADRWIERVLIDIADNDIALDGSSITVAFFKAFHQTQPLAGLYRYLRLHERENPTAIEEAVLSLSRAERCAALLADEICFSETEVAEILGIPTSDVARLRAAASDGLDTDLHQAALNHAHRDAFGNELRS